MRSSSSAATMICRGISPTTFSEGSRTHDSEVRWKLQPYRIVHSRHTRLHLGLRAAVPERRAIGGTVLEPFGHRYLRCRASPTRLGSVVLPSACMRRTRLTFRNRGTLNVGLRYDWSNSWMPAQCKPDSLVPSTRISTIRRPVSRRTPRPPLGATWRHASVSSGTYSATDEPP